MQKGLDMLLNKYSVAEDAVFSESGKVVTIGKDEYRLMPWESERRIIELYNLVKSGRLGAPSSYRIGHATKKGADLWQLLYREIGIAEYTLDEEMIDIFAINGANTLNAVCEMKSGAIVTIELSATLPEDANDVDKHEIIADGGVAADRVVDTQMPQSSIYVLGKNSRAYLDTDAELFGYREIEVNTIRNAFKLAANPAYREYNVKKNLHIDRVVAAAKESLDTFSRVEVK